MNISLTTQEIVDQGTLSFSIESRILRELGERLVKQPEVALIELVKNAYDADASSCVIEHAPPESITVTDTGHGMTLSQFRDGWMRIGTSSKEQLQESHRYGRVITGEKGIGRFAVRFLGKALRLETIADDPERGFKTRLIAKFNWPRFDRHQDLGLVKVPYRLSRVDDNTPTGTVLVISRLRPDAEHVNFRTVRTASMGVLTPYHSLLQSAGPDDSPPSAHADEEDPGFSLKILPPLVDEEGDVAAEVLESYVFRAKVKLKGNKLDLKVYRKGDKRPSINIVDTYKNSIGWIYADIRFFPRRKGTFTGLSIDGRVAQSWATSNAGIAVFDRTFRVHPYGMAGDDWLSLAADKARNERRPRSSVAKTHLPMTPEVQASTSENYMLRLPHPAQLIGIVQVQGRRNNEQANSDVGLIAAADREGFVENETFRQLNDIIRGAVEAIAFADRDLQQKEEEKKQADLLEALRSDTQSAIEEVQANPNISSRDKVRIIAALAQTQRLAEEHEESAREREQKLEVMSLLGIVAGFMTHEFGAALQDLEDAHKDLAALAKRDEQFSVAANALQKRIDNLREFVTYSQGYIRGASAYPAKPYTAFPRIMQVQRIFGKYAQDRSITIEVGVDEKLEAPLVPASLYNGIALNLYTNALKAVTARSGSGPRTIAFRAWNEKKWHYLEVSDTGIGIPTAMQKRVFDPLFTTTDARRDPLGSGMGLGLALVKRGAEAYGGYVDLVSPPAGFSTCVRIRLPLQPQAQL